METEKVFDVEIILLSGHKMVIEEMSGDQLSQLFDQLLDQSRLFIKVANHQKDISGFIRNDQIASLIAKPSWQ